MTTVRGVIAAAVGFIVALPPIVQALILLQGLDILSGLFVGARRKEISSVISWRGMCKKAQVWLLVISVYVLTRFGGQAVDQAWLSQVPIAGGIAAFFCIHELISIVENADRAGVPIPRVLRDFLEKNKEI